MGLCVWKGGWCGEERGVGRRVVWGWGEVCCGEGGVGCPKLAMASPWGDAPDRGCSRGVVVGVMWGGGWCGGWVEVGMWVVCMGGCVGCQNFARASPWGDASGRVWPREVVGEEGVRGGEVGKKGGGEGVG